MENKIIYIAGYGRSGSTILEMYLAEKLQVFPTGELTNLFEFYSREEECECGEKIRDCTFWKPVLVACDLVDKLNYSDRITKRAESMIVGKLYRREWMNIWGKVMNKIFEKSNDDVVVDSSKSARKNFYRVEYLKKLGFNVIEIFLIRKPEDVMKSAKKGSNQLIESRKGEVVKWGGAVRAGISWLITNYLAFNKLEKKGSLVINYDSFVDDPEKITSILKEYYGLDYSKSDRERHGISGNRLRRKDKKVKIRKVENRIRLNEFENTLAKYLNKYYYKVIDSEIYKTI